MGGKAGKPAVGTVFDILSNQRRRYALKCLSEHNSLALADLAEEVTRRELDTPISDIPEEDVLRVYTSLWHSHIPKLAESDVVAYNQERDLVCLGENADRVERVISLVSPVMEEPVLAD